jgi:hypothetical protein
VYLLGELAPVAREGDGVGRRELVHDRHQVRRPECELHEVAQRRARADRRRHLADVVLVPENDEDADVIAGRFRGGVILRPDRQRRVVVRRRARGFDQLDRVDRLLDAVFANLEVVPRQIGNRLTLAVEHGHVHADLARAAAEHGRLPASRRGLLPRRGLRCGRLRLRGR